jgi:hypothetical protein
VHADAENEVEDVPVTETLGEGLPPGDKVLDSVALKERPAVLLREPELEALAHRVVLLVTVGEVDALWLAREADAVEEAPPLADDIVLRLPHGDDDSLGLPLLLGEGGALGDSLPDTVVLAVAATLGRVVTVEVVDTEGPTVADCANDDDGEEVPRRALRVGDEDTVPHAETTLAVNDALGESVLLALTEADTLGDAEGLNEPEGDVHADAE